MGILTNEPVLYLLLKKVIMHEKRLTYYMLTHYFLRNLIITKLTKHFPPLS